MKEIPLTQGYVALVDDEDFETVSAFKWCAMRNKRQVRAGRCARRPDGSWAILSMHQFLLPGNKQVDHKDGNGLNNQKYNLRPATSRQNQRAFQHKRRNTSSKFRGVSLHSDGKWQAEIQVDGVGKYLGLFFLESDAALAYDAAARKFFGDFAAPNFPLTKLVETENA